MIKCSRRNWYRRSREKVIFMQLRCTYIDHQLKHFLNIFFFQFSRLSSHLTFVHIEETMERTQGKNKIWSWNRHNIYSKRMFMFGSIKQLTAVSRNQMLTHWRMSSLKFDCLNKWSWNPNRHIVVHTILRIEYESVKFHAISCN